MEVSKANIDFYRTKEMTELVVPTKKDLFVMGINLTVMDDKQHKQVDQLIQREKEAGLEMEPDNIFDVVEEVKHNGD